MQSGSGSHGMIGKSIRNVVLTGVTCPAGSRHGACSSFASAASMGEPTTAVLIEPSTIRPPPLPPHAMSATMSSCALASAVASSTAGLGTLLPSTIFGRPPPSRM